MAEYGQKLKLLMDEYGIAGRELAEGVNVSPALVSKWRSGARAFQRKDEDAARRLAAFLVGRIGARDLSRITGMIAEELPQKLAGWLFDGQRIEVDVARVRAGWDASPAPPQQDVFLGTAGLQSALACFARRAHDGPDAAERALRIHVYLSSDESGILLQKDAAGLWDYLRGIGGGEPIRFVFEQNQDARRTADILRHLLPHIEEGACDPVAIASSGHHFCYNLSVLAENRCMVMTTEPAGVPGSSVSLFVDAPEFVRPMTDVLGKLAAAGRPLVRRLATGRAETEALPAYFAEDGDVAVRSSALNLLYLSPEAFEEMLRPHVRAQLSRHNYTERFRKHKALFDAFLENNNRPGGASYSEVVSVDAIEDAVADSVLRVHDLGLPLEGDVRVGPEIVVAILSGMADCCERYPRCDIRLAQAGAAGAGAGADATWILKGRARGLVHLYSRGREKRCFETEDATMIALYDERYEAEHGAKGTIRAKMTVVRKLREYAATAVAASASAAGKGGGMAASKSKSKTKADSAGARLAALTETLAVAIHEDYLLRQKAAAGGAAGAGANAVPWTDLPEHIKEENRRQARAIPEKLWAVGCGFDVAGGADADGGAAGDAPDVTAFTAEEILALAVAEHNRWMFSKAEQGYVYGAAQNDDLAQGPRTHPYMVPWDRLPEQEKQKDIDTAENIHPLLKAAGMRVYRRV
ncbi:MAG: hypothetical protein LBR00_02645 [Clostridiales Family XIII bacterium]|jgi:transcriptional regulator with XRE-family HTH domain|nr:hypothetical protein [Clostridiales Family XIII bacterium]